jgi:hypothetical protein
VVSDLKNTKKGRGPLASGSGSKTSASFGPPLAKWANRTVGKMIFRKFEFCQKLRSTYMLRTKIGFLLFFRVFEKVKKRSSREVVKNGQKTTFSESPKMVKNGQKWSKNDQKRVYLSQFWSKLVEIGTCQNKKHLYVVDQNWSKMGFF